MTDDDGLQINFDFDSWAALAKNDPEEFERQRHQVLGSTCEKLGGLQKPAIAGICWRVEMERKRSASPLQLCLKLPSLMWDRYTDMADALSDAQDAMAQQGKRRQFSITQIRKDKS